MLQCFSTLCSCGGYNYQKMKKLNVGKKICEQESCGHSTRENTGDNNGGSGDFCGFASELLTVTPDQMNCLHNMASLVLSSFRTCNIPFLLDNFCPLKKSSAANTHMSNEDEKASGQSNQRKKQKQNQSAVCECVSVCEASGAKNSKKKSKKRGCRAGKRVQQRSRSTPTHTPRRSSMGMLDNPAAVSCCSQLGVQPPAAGDCHDDTCCISDVHGGCTCVFYVVLFSF
jgi:hypothetical protein